MRKSDFTLMVLCFRCLSYQTSQSVLSKERIYSTYTDLTNRWILRGTRFIFFAVWLCKAGKKNCRAKKFLQQFVSIKEKKNVKCFVICLKKYYVIDFIESIAWHFFQQVCKRVLEKRGQLGNWVMNLFKIKWPKNCYISSVLKFK